MTETLAPDLRGKSVLITGASTGIGAAAARAIAPITIVRPAMLFYIML